MFYSLSFFYFFSTVNVSDDQETKSRRKTHNSDRKNHTFRLCFDEKKTKTFKKIAVARTDRPSLSIMINSIFNVRFSGLWILFQTIFFFFNFTTFSCVCCVFALIECSVWSVQNKTIAIINTYPLFVRIFFNNLKCFNFK